MLWACAATRRIQDDDWVKKCMEYEVEGSTPRGIPKRKWIEVVEKDCQARKLNKEDAMDRSRWRKLMFDDQDGCEWVGVSSGTSPPGSPSQRAIKQLCKTDFLTAVHLVD